MKERQAIPWMQSQEEKEGHSVKTEMVSGEMQSTEANDVYSEAEGPTPGKALAILLTPLEKVQISTSGEYWWLQTL